MTCSRSAREIRGLISARTSTGLAVITAARLRAYRGNEKVRLRNGAPDEEAYMRSPSRDLGGIQYARDSRERARSYLLLGWLKRHGSWPEPGRDGRAPGRPGHAAGSVSALRPPPAVARAAMGDMSAGHSPRRGQPPCQAHEAPACRVDSCGAYLRCMAETHMTAPRRAKPFARSRYVGCDWRRAARKSPARVAAHTSRFRRPVAHRVSDGRAAREL